MIPKIWILKIGNKIEKEGLAEWLTGGDNKVKFTLYGFINDQEGEYLDQLESSKETVDVSILLKRCWDGVSSVECDENTVEYYSQEGKATIEWEVGDRVVIYINFQGDSDE